MKNYLLILFSVFMVQLTVSQQRGIKITNAESGKETFIAEYKRIKVISNDATTISGRFIVKENGIYIKGQKIGAESIIFIKKNPAIPILSLVGGGVLIGFGGLIGVIGALTGSSTAVIAGSGMIVAGVAVPFIKINRKYSSQSQWTFELVY